MKLAEKQAELGKIVKRMREINDAAKKDGERAFTESERTEYDKLEADCDKLETEIRELQKTAEREARLKEREEHLAAAPPPVSKPTPGSHRSGSQAANGNGHFDHPYAHHVRFMPAACATPEYAEAFRMALVGDMAGASKRADTLQVGLFTKGGALQPPQQFIAELIKALDDAVFVRQYGRKFRLEQAASLGVPSLDTDIDDADWTSELATGNQGDITLGKRELRPHPLGKLVKVSKTLRRISAIPLDQLVRERLEYKFSVTNEKGFLTGTGAQQPLGIFTATAEGISTSRDVSTDNETTNVTADGLIEAKHAMKAGYWRIARWVLHRDCLKRIRKLKDGNGQYLWQPGISTGAAPNTILDLPYDISEFAPNTFTTGKYVAALCAWPFYWIADALDMTVQVLDQLYAANNQDGYLGRMETDGMPVLEEAFVRVKLA
jgi:HK97 family phage major capsid protein